MTNNNSDSIVVEDNAQFDADPKSPGFQTDAEKSISDDSKNISHSMNHDETSSLINEKQKCPRCGKLTLQVSFPDTYEVMTTCSSCGFVMKIGINEWHHMKSSPNMKEKIKQMANKKELLGLA